MAANIRAAFPNIPTERFVDDNNIITPVWARFLYDLWMRTGGVFDKVNTNINSLEILTNCEASLNVRDAAYISGSNKVSSAAYIRNDTVPIVAIRYLQFSHIRLVYKTNLR